MSPTCRSSNTLLIPSRASGRGYKLFSPFLVKSRLQTDRLQTESDAYEPTVQVARVGSKITKSHFLVIIDHIA